MQGRIAIIAVFLAAIVLAPAGDAKLTPAEQTWITPLLRIWNTQYAAGGVVVKQAEAKNALVAGSKPNNLNLTVTLAALIECKVPSDQIRKAGKPPTPRLVVFRKELDAACTYDYKGATLFAKAIGAVRVGKSSLAASRLKAGAADFYQGRVQLAKAYEYLSKIGKASSLTA
jgi:hypothetical protein